MSEERARILNMLADGKINAEEAERLLDALQGRAGDETVEPEAPATAKDLPKFMYVKVTGGEKADTVDVKVPLNLLRAGLRLTSLIPPQAMDQINDSMSEHGMSIDFSNLKPDDIEELIAGLADMEVKVKSKEGEDVRVYCA